MLASSKGHTSVMMALMENHSDLNAVDKGKVIKHPNLPKDIFYSKLDIKIPLMYVSVLVLSVNKNQLCNFDGMELLDSYFERNYFLSIQNYFFCSKHET